MVSNKFKNWHEPASDTYFMGYIEDIEELSSEEYEEKPYISEMKVSQGRVFFSSRSFMLSTIQWNFQNKPEYKANQYLCRCKEHVDSQSSLLTCKLYSNQRIGLDLYNSDTDLVTYFQRIIQERRQEEERKNYPIYN